MRLEAGDFPLVELTAPEVVVAEAETEVEIDPEASPRERRILLELAGLGLRRETLGRRFVDPERVDEVREGSMGAVDMVQILGLPGIRVRTLERGERCVYSSRNMRSPTSLRGSDDPACALLVLDGVPVEMSRMETVPAETVSAMAYLRSSEAGARFGTGTDGGVLLVWTLRGGGP